MQYALLAVLVALGACAADAGGAQVAPPLGGSPHDGAPDGAAGEAGSDGPARACDAPLASLSGTAMYVAGSMAAADPAALATNTQSCGDWMSEHRADLEAGVPATVGISSGAVPSEPLTGTALIASSAGAAGCNYTLRVTAPPTAPAVPCATSVDYQLTVP